MNQQGQPHPASMQISGEQLVQQFFGRFYNIMMIGMFVQIYNKEQADEQLNKLLELTMSEFENSGFVKQIQQQDIAGYFELKKVINQEFDSMKRSMMQIYEVALNGSQKENEVSDTPEEPTTDESS